MSKSRVLILEDEFFVAVDLEAVVHSHTPDADVVICASVEAARFALTEPVAFALLDIDVVDGKTFEVAAILREKGIPVAFVSGSRPDEVPEVLASIPFIKKPFAAPMILDAINSMNFEGRPAL